MNIARCGCGAIWQQRGNQSGHCSTCHETFSSNWAFDLHRRPPVDGKGQCLFPGKVFGKDGEPKLVERTDRIGTVQWGQPGSRFDGSRQDPVIIDEAWTMTGAELAQFVQRVGAAHDEVPA